MASSSENQGLQIAVIIFALLTIIMSGATFYVFKLSEDAELRAADARQKEATATKSLADALAEMEKYRQMMGTPYAAPNMKLDAVQVAFKADMDTYASTFPEEKRFYSDALSELKVAYNKLSSELAAERKKIVDLDAEIKKAMADKVAQIDTHRQEAAAAQQGTKDATVKLDEERKKLNADKQGLLTELNNEKQKYAEAEQRYALAAKKATADLDAMKLLKEGIQDQLTALEKKDFVAADGEIRWVSPGTKTVWVNLGRDDGLMKHVTFSVYGLDQNGVARTDPKGSIEVTQILGGHLAEARIVEDSLSDPILIRDQLYTPLWHPGRQEQFAICGLIDIDKDGVSDATFIKDMIKRQGGMWVAELLADGSVNTQGDGMTINTRYLIQGDAFPNGGDEYGKMLGQAKQLGVEVINVEKFLDYVGWKESSKVVNFGRDAKAEDFLYDPNQDKARRPAPSSAGANNFRRRTPPKSNNGRAY